MSAASACTVVARPRWNRPNCGCGCCPTRSIPRPPNPSSRMPEPAWQARFDAWRARVDAALAQSLPSPQAPPRRLHAAMRHAVLLGGKRMRPLLAYAVGDAFGADEASLDAPAMAVE